MKHANIALFIPHNGCPHQCSFCNQVRITGMQKQPSPQDVISAVTTARESLGERIHKAEIAFFGGSFTAVEPNYMCSLLETASAFVKSGTVAGIRISTRPDALEAPVLDLLKCKGVTAIELGAQSMDDSVLAMNGRGHTAQQVREASRRIRDNGFSLGLQMMTGLYGSSAKQDRQTAEELAQLRPDTMRIYPTVVMEGTRLAKLYQQGLYHPMELDEAVALCAELLQFFEQQSIEVIRLGLHSTPQMETGRLAGAWHPAFRELCESRRMLLRIRRHLLEYKVPEGDIVLYTAVQSVSQTVGQHKSNLKALGEMGYRVRIVPDRALAKGFFRIEF